jgi:hypothetical protein
MHFTDQLTAMLLNQLFQPLLLVLGQAAAAACNGFLIAARILQALDQLFFCHDILPFFLLCFVPHLSYDSSLQIANTYIL